MNHGEIQDLLEAYVDETLDRSTRAEVDRHLAGCEECRAILDDVPAVELGDIDPVGFDDKAMRRVVRRTLLRVAANAVLIAIAGILVVTLAGWLVFQPLVVNRGGRAVAATAITRDLAVMYNPGSGLSEIRFDSGIISRTSEAEIVMPVGAAIVERATVRTRIGPFSFGEEGSVYTDGVYGTGAGDVAEQLTAVGDGTVATVELQFDPPLTLARAQELADSSLDVRVVWAGFSTSDAGLVDRVGLQPGGWVGYGTCDARGAAPQEISLGGSSGTSGANPFTETPSIDRALDATLAAIDDFLDYPELVADWDSDVTHDSMIDARTHLAGDPGVVVLVVTGPTPELLRFLAEATPTAGASLAIDFTNWQQPVLCGR